MNVAIREATMEDALAVVELIREMAEPGGNPVMLTAEYVGRYLTSPVSHILIAEVEGQPVGLLSYSVRPDLYHAANSCYVEELVVKSGMRGQGVGGALLDAVLRRAGEDCAEISLSVMPNNTDAIRFYREHGLAEEALFLEKHF